METWKQIKGYEGFYEISDLGRVKSVIRRTTISRNRPSIKKENILKWRLNSDGYPVVTFVVNRVYKQFLVHRLIAEHFIDNPNNYKVVNHKDGNKKNCSISNLEWTTSSLNQIHAYEIGLRNRKLNSEQKAEILKLRQQGLTYYQIADKYNVSYQLIARICTKNH